MSLLLALTLLAHADVPPAFGQKYATFQVTVEGVPADGPRQLVVFPWSLSGGVPMAEVGEVPTSGPLSFGRRIAGPPHFWLVPTAELPALHAMEQADRRAWFETDAATRCTGDAPQPQFNVSATGPDTLTERFVVDIAADGACAVRRVAEAPVTAATSPVAASGCGCAVSGATGGWVALVALAMIRRRRR
jgi:MYXO-CTERM domain-containing protein